MTQFYDWLGLKKSGGIRLAVMDPSASLRAGMWKPFRTVTRERAPQAAILFDTFHIMRHLGDALDKVRKAEYARLSGKDRRYIKGQKYTLLSHRENLTMEGRRNLKTLLTANKRLNTAYLLKEAFGRLLGWHRRLLPAREQGVARLRRGPQQQDPRHPETGLRTARRRISTAQGPHLHAAGALKCSKFSHSIT